MIPSMKFFPIGPLVGRNFDQLIPIWVFRNLLPPARVLSHCEEGYSVPFQKPLCYTGLQLRARPDMRL